MLLTIGESVKFIRSRGKQDQLAPLASQIADGFIYHGSPELNRLTHTSAAAGIRNALKSVQDIPYNEQTIFTKAAIFLTAEYCNLGLRGQLTLVGPLARPINSSGNSESQSRGLAYPRQRAFFVDRSQAKDLITATGVAVHELVHLTSRVDLYSEETLKYGFTINSFGSTRFKLLEEFTAVSMQARYWKSKGLKTRVDSKSVHVTPYNYNPVNLEFLSILKDVYQHQTHKKNTTNSASAEFYDDQSLRISIPLVFWSNRQIECTSIYSEAFTALQDLAVEALSNLNHKQAQQKFEDLLMTMHVQGDIVGACRLFRSNFGNSILPVLAFTAPGFDPDETKNVTGIILLRAYVDARNLDPQTRTSVRNRIAKIMRRLNDTNFDYS